MKSPRIQPQLGSSATHRGHSAAAFTLIEVLVSSAVLSIVMFILLSTLGTSLSLWRTTESNISADREGRSANMLLAQDLANAVMLTNQNLWPQVTATSLGFLTLRPSDYQPTNKPNVGDLCFVEYKVQRDTNSTSSTNFMALTRNFVGSADTYAAVRAGNLPTPDPANAQVLAANVVPNTRVLSFNSEVNDDFFARLGTNGLPVTGAQRPAIIDVTISTADEETVRTLDIPNKQLRTVGYFGFRVALPKP
jgi:prepilin-type N-terminal cleavage/methylation domain-containing protein